MPTITDDVLQRYYASWPSAMMCIDSAEGGGGGGEGRGEGGRARKRLMFFLCHFLRQILKRYHAYQNAKGVWQYLPPNKSDIILFGHL